ncbi:TPA: hypothetical protein U2L32_002531 [Burkholderia cenocepacia]|nr:hypothetical protein [Burkholderia cenocepacia]
MNTQMPLDLRGGHHVGPLFVPVKRRAPLITSGLMAGKRRRARERRATPPWLSPLHRVAIASLYLLAHTMTHLSGEQHVVDHIVPLDGKLVCGLHVPWNMRVTHWRENAVKAWHTWPDMPFEQIALF